MIEYEDWWEVISVQVLQKIIEQYIINFEWRNMHHLSYISNSIWGRGSGDNFTTEFPERLNVRNIKDAYWSSNQVNYVGHILKYNDQYSGLYIMDKTLLYPALPGWYNMECGKLFTCCLLPIQGEIHGEPILDLSSIARITYGSPHYNNRYIIWVIAMATECADVPSQSPAALYQLIEKFQTVDSYVVHKLKTTGETMLVDWCLDWIRMYS